MEWLGPDRDSIGREKAGIARRGRPAIVGQLDPPDGLLAALAERGAQVERAGIDFSVERHEDGWRWRHRDGSAMELPDPYLAAPVQHANAAAAIAALHAFGDEGHNPQAARALAEWLDASAHGAVHAVYGALADKDVGGVIGALGARIAHWHLAGLEQASPRGMDVVALSEKLQSTLPQASFDAHPDVAAALAAARQATQPGD